jgi:hypothetical protein
MPPDTAPVPAPTDAPSTDVMEPQLNYRQRRHLRRMAAKMARAYISSVWPTNYHKAMNRDDAKQ